MGHRAGVISSAERIERGSWPGSAHEARRFILERLPGSCPVEGLSAEADRYGRAEEPAVLITPTIIEDGPFRAIRVAEVDSPRGGTGFTGFLDGTQKVEVLAHDNGIPILWATVSAAVRTRVDRRMIAWPGRNPIVRSAFYVPLKYVTNLKDDVRNHATTVDTSAASSADKVPSRHPAALREAAIKKIQYSRERAELELAEAWCASEPGVLYVDGSLTGSRLSSESSHAVGVVKSHNRIYADGEALDVLIGLRAGERTSVFRPPLETNRFSVASWYVRVRQAAGHDALFGLVRVEAALSTHVAARADEISRWIIAEGSPLALPDGRWDKMAYGIRDTEEFLRAIQ
ncbi:MAG TPA: hypothetical protein VM053_07165 [Gemmatimonadaceae bacterium]|nr:hypothetical protein [Gemmatimonadaceae bacterium]